MEALLFAPAKGHWGMLLGSNVVPSVVFSLCFMALIKLAA